MYPVGVGLVGFVFVITSLPFTVTFKSQVPGERPFVPQLNMYWLLVPSYLNRFPVVAALVDVASAYVPSTLLLYFTMEILTVAVLSGVTPSFWKTWKLCNDKKSLLKKSLSTFTTPTVLKI